MRNSCIEHPAKESFIIIREWQLEFCDNDKTGAALISFFEYWHNIKLEMAKKNKEANEIAEKHGDSSNLQDESLFQFHTEKQLEDGIKISKKTKIAESLKKLESKGVIQIFKNPNRRYKFDKTRHFLFHPEIINEWLKNRKKPTKNKNGFPSRENGSRQNENGSRQNENGGAIPETTSKTTSNEKRKDKEKKEVSFIFNFWNEQKLIIHRDIDSHIPTIKSALKKYSVDELKGAIENLSTAINSDKYWWTHKYTLSKFLTQKGVIDQFLTENDPLSSLLDAKQNNKQSKAAEKEWEDD